MIANMLGKITEKLEDYAENKVELVKLEMEEKISRIIVKAIQAVIFGITALMFLAFLTLGIAIVINNALNSTYLGYIIISGFYLLIFVSLFIFKNNKFFKEIDLIDL